MSHSPPLRPWLGTCPECGGVAVYRESEPGHIVGACCAGPGCWWAGKVDGDETTALVALAWDAGITPVAGHPPSADA